MKTDRGHVKIDRGHVKCRGFSVNLKGAVRTFRGNVRTNVGDVGNFHRKVKDSRGMSEKRLKIYRVKCIQGS